MPWKNGGGRTTEIASHPAHAALDAFSWRVSVADVARDGPFSAFDGIDRTLVLLAGAGMRLERDGAAVDLTAPYEPYAFRGEDAIHCVLHDGAVRDFNLMLRRGAARGGVTVVRGAGARIAPAQFRLCYTAAGVAECLLAGHPPIALATERTLLVEATPGAASSLSIHPTSADAAVIAVHIDLVP